MIPKGLVENVLSAALDRGADFAELFFEDSAANSIRLQGEQVEDAVSTRLYGAGLRVLKGSQCAYAYASNPDEAALFRLAAQAAAALPGDGRIQSAPFVESAYRTLQQSPFAAVESSAKTALLREASAAARAVSAEITQVTALYMDKVQRVLIANSEGVFAQDERPRTRAVVQAVAMAGTSAQTGFEGPGFCLGFEAYRSAIDLSSAAKAAAETAVTMLHAAECPGGFVPAVIDGGFGGVIFHEACGHSLEATSVSRGNSEFCGMLGKLIASERVTAIDDGTLQNEWGSINIDDEGLPGRRNVLIEKGVLTGYLIDRLGGRRMGMEPTGSARRQSYAYIPTSRMTNTFIAPGTDDEAEMISTMGEGLYARRMGGGSVNPATGEFNFAVSEGYWVRDGKILRPVRGATLVGRGAEILKHIDRVGKRMWMGQGMCGSLSGSVPTNVGQPRIRVSGITVGGRGGAL